MFNSFRQVRPNHFYLQNDLGYQLCDNGGLSSRSTFIEQSNEGKVIEFYSWADEDVDLIDANTIYLCYEKGKRPPFSHKRND